VDLRKTINKQQVRRSFRVRRRLHGTAARPRLSIHRTLTHFACQLIDDDSGRTLVAATTKSPSFRSTTKYCGNCAAAAKLGTIIAEKAIQAGIKTVAFDRGHRKYHGRVAAFADAARQGGLEF
jgi:large subunit ribosomal protein L18